MSCSRLNSLKGVIWGIIYGTTRGVTKGDTRSLDSNSSVSWFGPFHLDLGIRSGSGFMSMIGIPPCSSPWRRVFCVKPGCDLATKQTIFGG